MVLKPTPQAKPRTPEETRRYFSQPDWAMKNLGPLPEILPEELVRMTIEITLGAVEPPKEFDAIRREAWAELKLEIDAIHEAGGMVDIPTVDLP